MNCVICDREARPDNTTCAAECAALETLSKIQATYDMDPGYLSPEAIADERAVLRWDIRARWHEVRGLPFNEKPPKSHAEIELERRELAAGGIT